MREIVIHCMIYAEPSYANESADEVVEDVTALLNAGNCSISVFNVGEQETED